MGSGGGGGGSSTPPFDFAEAQKIVDRAYEQQQRATTALEQKSAPYETKRELSQADLGKLLTGRTGPEAVSRYEQRFEQGIPALTREFEEKQRNFQPRLLESPSFASLTNALRGGAQEYGTAMNQASTRASSRLYEALATPMVGFELAAQSPAFSALRNPVFMEYAKRPPTVSTDVDSYKQLMTYNV